MGFDQIEFAQRTLQFPPDPWQRWALIHGGELLDDGRPRFRVFLVIVARQNGKTTICVILAGYWMIVASVPMILGTSTKLDYAKESWSKVVQLIERVARREDAEGRFVGSLIQRDRWGGPKWTRRTNGEQECWMFTEPNDALELSRYKIGTADESGGRSLTIDRLICDELRQHDTWDAWMAAEQATGAVWDAQVWPLSNAGSAKSVVLNQLRRDALDFIETGDGDPRIGIAEWSADESFAERVLAGEAVTDAEIWAALRSANPNLGARKDPMTMFNSARAAIRAGGDQLMKYLTEAFCVNVQADNPALDMGGWRGGLEPGDLSAQRGRVALVLDVAPDDQHATAVAAAQLPDGRVRIEAAGDWHDPAQAWRELPALVRKTHARVFGWFPNGAAAGYAAKLRSGWEPPGVTVTEIKAEAPVVCMGLATLIRSRQLVQSGDPLLTTQAGAAQRRKVGSRWVFAEPKDSDIHVDGMYAAAGAAHLAQTMPAPYSDALPSPLES